MEVEENYEKFCQRQDGHHRTVLVAGSVFGASGEGYVRMSFANSYENIVEGTKRMHDAVVELLK